MSKIRVVLCAQNFSTTELASTVRTLAREYRSIHLYGMDQDRLDELERSVGSRRFRRVRPVGRSTVDTIVIPYPHRIVAGALNRLHRTMPGAQIVRVYVPGTDPASCIVRWSSSVLEARGPDIAELPGFHEDSPAGADDGSFRHWIRGDEIGVYPGDSPPVGWFMGGASRTVRRAWDRHVRSTVGRVMRQIQFRHSSGR